MVFVSADVSSLKALTRTLLGTFIFVAICVMLLAFFFTTYASQRQTKPLMEMAEAARTMGFPDDRLEVLPTAQAALDAIGPLLSEGDLVLAKGSRSVGLDRFAKGVLA